MRCPPNFCLVERISAVSCSSPSSQGWVLLQGHTTRGSLICTGAWDLSITPRSTSSSGRSRRQTLSLVSGTALETGEGQPLLSHEVGELVGFSGDITRGSLVLVEENWTGIRMSGYGSVLSLTDCMSLGKSLSLCVL